MTTTTTRTTTSAPRASVQAGYCGDQGTCALERSECADVDTFRSSRQMQGAPERAHGGVCLLSETIVGKNLGSCVSASAASGSAGGGVCAPNEDSCVGGLDYEAATAQHLENASGCVVEKTTFGSCGGGGGGGGGNGGGNSGGGGNSVGGGALCAWSASSCDDDGGAWFFPNPDCTCDQVRVGGCRKKAGGDEDDRVYCAVSADACDDGSTFLDLREVESAAGYQCFLCRRFVGQDAVVDHVAPEGDGDGDPDVATTTTTTTLVARIHKYPGADISRSPQGNAYVTFHDRTGDVTIDLVATNLKRGCSVTNTNKNGCGVHVHAGKSCDEDALVQGHYYDDSDGREDPWADMRYNSDNDGTSTSYSSTTTTMSSYSTTTTTTTTAEESGGIVLAGGSGTSAKDNVGRALVVHDADGKRIGCGLLEYYAGDVDSIAAQDGGSAAATDDDDQSLVLWAVISSAVAVALIGLFALVLFRRRKTSNVKTRPPKTLQFEDGSSSKDSTQQDSEDLNVI